jgi:hypothetical protein
MVTNKDAFEKSRVHPSIPQGERFEATPSA